MKFTNRYDGIDDYAVLRVRHHARHLSKYVGHGLYDIEDIEQELMLDLLRRLPRFDSTKSCLRTFIANIVRNGASMFRDQVQAQKRGASICHCSLHEPVSCEDGGEPLLLIDTIDSSRSLWPVGTSWDVRSDIRVDVSSTVSRLPEPLANLAKRLATETVLEISRNSGPSRDAIYCAIRKLREAFTEAGLDFYLQSARQIPSRLSK